MQSALLRYYCPASTTLSLLILLQRLRYFKCLKKHTTRECKRFAEVHSTGTGDVETSPATLFVYDERAGFVEQCTSSDLFSDSGNFRGNYTAPPGSRVLFTAERMKSHVLCRLEKE